MAILEITPINPIPPALQARQVGNSAGPSPAGAAGVNPVPAAVATPLSEADPVLQNELLFNETVRSLNFVPRTGADALLINVAPPPLADILVAQEPDFVLQSKLVINETLQNLAFVSRAQPNALLINVTPPSLEADETLQDLDAIPRNEVLVNETLLALNVSAQAVAVAEEERGAGEAAPVRQTLAAALPVTVAVTAALPVVASAAENVVGALPQATAVLAPIPFAPTFVTQSFTPFRLPFSLLNPDRTPYVIAVYETRNPNQGPGEPAPIMAEILPPLPAGKVRPVGRAALRRSWSRQQMRVYEENMVAPIPVTERDLQHVLSQVNEDLAANGSPLHLVFAKKEAGYGVDVYDCSDNEVCRLTHDVTLKSENLTATLDNLQRETGIIIDTTS